MIQTLFHLFSLVGIVSILAWGAALLLVPVCSPARWRTRGWTLALVLALAGLFMARINSHQVSRIEVDREAEIEAARQVMVAQRRRELEVLVRESRDDPGRIRFAEDNPYDALDLAGMETRTFNDGSIYAQAAAEAARAEVPAYRQRGRQERTAGMRSGDGDLEQMAQEIDSEKVYRKLPEADKMRAERLDKLNLLFARLTFVVAFLFAAGNYLSHFNRTFGRVPPLPLSGPLMDAFSPKTHSVRLAGATPATVRKYLAKAVRKGESFIYFGADDDLPGAFSRMALVFGPALGRFQREWRRLTLARHQAAAAAAAVPPPPEPEPAAAEELPPETAVVAPDMKPKSAAARAAQASAAARAARLRKPKTRTRQKPRRPKRRRIPLRQRLAPVMALLKRPLLWGRDLARALALAGRGGMVVKLPKLAISLENPPPSADVLFESAWFGRHCVTVKGQEMGDALVRELTWWFMEMRRKVRAKARRSINIVWTLPNGIERETLERLIQACRDTNCKLVVVVPESETAPAPDDLFEEAIVAPA